MTAAGTDQAARHLITHALDDTLVVEASAGTGKTTALVNRMLSVLAEGRASVREIVAVTFTERAAGELKLRLRQGLEERRREASDARVVARIEDAIQHLEEAHVSTIHGFCADLLRERPVEARVDPAFRVLTEGQATRVFNEAFSAWFGALLADPPEGVRRSLRRPSRGFRPGGEDEDGPVERLRRAGLELARWRDLRAPWARDTFDRAGAAASLAGQVRGLADLSAKPSSGRDALFASTEPVRRLSRALRALDESGPTDIDGLESQLIELGRTRDLVYGRQGSGPSYGQGVTRTQVLAARDALLQGLALFERSADADLAALLQGELLACVDAYDVLKSRAGALDFFDLLLRARDLVRDNRDVRAYFQRRFTRIFVDEFQDTDPLQAELILLLSSADPEEVAWHRVVPVPGKLFIVGDPKQSIYRFRRADLATYRRVCDLLVERGAARVELRRSFRSPANLQRLVNAAFTPVMDGSLERLQARYVPLEPSRRDHPGQPSVVVLPVPAPYGLRAVAAGAIERSLPDAVGAYIEWMVARSGWTITERSGPGADDVRVPLLARHVCVLFRRFISYGADVTRPYVEALEARGVRHLLIGGKAFHDRQEIEMLRSALTAVEWPDDQLSVFATLRGPLFAISDADLLEYRHLAGRFHPFGVPAAVPTALDPVRAALALVASLHRTRNRVPIADTVAALMERTRAHVGLVLRPGGEQALANVLHVAELARQYELEGGRSFRGFVERLQEEASAQHDVEAPILEDGSDGVRLMTVHKAKGLEFPVVVLADITARLAQRQAARYVDSDRGLCALRLGGWMPKDLDDHQQLELGREQSEGERVAYVAATRGRDLLVIPAVGDEPYTTGWVSPLNDAIYPPSAARRVQTPAEGCPPFVRKDSVLTRPHDDPARESTVCPGRHTLGPPDAPYSIVWWSPEPAALPLAVPPLPGLRRDDLIVRDVPATTVQARLDAFRSWRSGRDAAVAAAGEPTIRVVAASEAGERVESEVADRIAVSMETVPGPDARPGGARFGTLVHALLAGLPLAPDADHTLTRLAEAHARILGADAAETSAAADLVRRVRQHPVMAAALRAAAGGGCFRETPVTLRLDDGGLVEGVVDLAFDDGRDFVIVDFKTDRELDGSLERYRRQVQVYAAAISIATGRPARGVLLRI